MLESSPTPEKPSKRKVTKKVRKNKKSLAASPTITGDMTAEELAFLKAIDDFKRKNVRPFPTWREVLSILKSLGYSKVENGASPSESDDREEIPEDLT